jgi:hypothetical protein
MNIYPLLRTGITTKNAVGDKYCAAVVAVSGVGDEHSIVLGHFCVVFYHFSVVISWRIGVAGSRVVLWSIGVVFRRFISSLARGRRIILEGFNAVAVVQDPAINDTTTKSSSVARQNSLLENLQYSMITSI